MTQPSQQTDQQQYRPTDASSSLTEMSQLQQSGSGVIVYGTNFEVGNNYQIVSPIGQGAYGVVVAARVKNLDALPNVMDDGRAVNDQQEEEKQ